MIDKDYIPIFSALVGGLLTVVGGFVANYLLQSTSRKVEKRKLVRDKLEEAYLLSYGVIDWLQNEMRQMALPKNESEKVDCPIHRIAMLVKLYEPRLSSIASEYSENVEIFRSSVFNYWKETYEAKTKLPVERFTALIEQPFDNVKLSHEKLLSSIEKVVHENL